MSDTIICTDCGDSFIGMKGKEDICPKCLKKAILGESWRFNE